MSNLHPRLIQSDALLTRMEARMRKLTKTKNLFYGFYQVACIQILIWQFDYRVYQYQAGK